MVIAIAMGHDGAGETQAMHSFGTNLLGLNEREELGARRGALSEEAPGG